MTQAETARAFAALHRKGDPVKLYNIWDAAGAKTLAKAGADAVATGSLAVAAAHGYTDGQGMPLDFALRIAERIVASVDVPVTVDFEGGYAVEPDEVAANVARVLDVGAIGINFEDQVVGGEGLHPIETQTARIRAIRAMADETGIPLFINARTDIFLKDRDQAHHAGFMAETKERAAAYAEAGASGFFAPALFDPELIGDLVEATKLPVNIIMLDPAPSIEVLKSLNVARLSWGPVSYYKALSDLEEAYTGATE